MNNSWDEEYDHYFYVHAKNYLKKTMKNFWQIANGSEEAGEREMAFIGEEFEESVRGEDEEEEVLGTKKTS
ncbi:105_t:CDS:2 [Diversispora eburnea]|uniref:105_t:CDS:1 n=1 Tax=Diversispora eburnea TaxID=1213867 RepID=A0A9N8VHA0_9GLOM|nr:105_t:CDS:2 [Diversispora eburnea]